MWRIFQNIRLETSGIVRIMVLLGLSVGGMNQVAGRTIDPQTADGWPHETATAQVVQRGQVSLAQAIEMAQRRYQGRVVRAETKTQNGQRVHEIRILGDDGRVRTVRINAQGGGGP